jgi:voltage-gated potassium channel
MKERLSRFIHHKITDFAVMALIVLSVLLLIVESFYRRAPDVTRALDIAGLIIAAVFTVELSIRFYVARSKRRYFKEYWIDILSILPILRPLRILRILRLARLFRLGILANKRLSSLLAIFREGRGEQVAILVVIVTIVLFGGIAINVIEGERNPDFHSIAQSLLWSVLSLASVQPTGGTPQTTLGWLVSLVVMLGGVTVFAMFTGLFSAVMVQRLRSRMEVREMELNDLENHIVICGWNRAGPIIVEEFQADPELSGRPIVIISEDGDQPKFDPRVVRTELVYYLRGDCTSVQTLEGAGIQRASFAFILADKTIPRSDQDRDARTVLTALTIEKMNKTIFTCVELLNRANESHLKMAGVEEVVVSSEFSGNLLAAASRSQGMLSLLNELLTVKEGNQFYKVPVPPSAEGRDFLELSRLFKAGHDAILIALECRDPDGRRRILTNPPAGHRVSSGDLAVVIAQRKPVFNG